MSLDTSGFLLEGIRVATGNNTFTYPPRSIVTNSNAFNSSPNPAQYIVWVGGQVSGSKGIEIADPDLILYWSRNNNTIIRFDWDGFSKRWNTSPGGAPESIGIFGNSPRLIVPVLDPSVSLTESPYSIYVGNPLRLVTFTISIVATSTDFGNPSAGTVEVASDSGQLNFGSADLNNSIYKNQTVYLTRQSFFDRKKVKGNFGILPENSADSYDLFLNPIPGLNQIPRIRIGYRRYLTAVQVLNESSLGVPSSGTVNFSADTGRVVFAPSDIDTYAGETVYYDGVILGNFSLDRGIIGPVNTTWPNSLGLNSHFINLTDSTRYVFFIEAILPRYYYNVIIVNSSGLSSPPPVGSIFINSDDGSVYINAADPSAMTGATLTFVDTVHEIENGVSIQLFRSAVNGAGVESVPDFVEIYSVSSQLIADGIGLASMVMLPTIPLEDSTLSYSVNQGSSGGSFVGVLNPGYDPTQLGLGYSLNLDSRQLLFTFRKTSSLVLPTSTPSFKLPDAAISSFGFEATRNNIPIFPGVDFQFNTTTGLIEFITPIGQDDPNNLIGITGTITLPNSISFLTGVIPASPQINKVFYINSGPNAGIYTIIANNGASDLLASPNFVRAGSVTGDLRTEVEILVDRIWKPFAPLLKKITISKSSSISGPFGPLDQTNYSPIASNGQINLSVPANPGDVFQVQYTSLDSPDNGVTVTPTPRTEFAGFKIRQETATYVQNTVVINFNPSGKMVLTTYPITLYIDGVTVPEANFNFTAPGSITISTPLTTQDILVDYFVAECPGGNTTFTLLHSPIDLDFPTITAGSATTTFNGNQTFLTNGSGILIDDSILTLVYSSVYNSSTDITTVTFSPIPVTGTTVNSTMKVCGPVNGSYLTPETSNVNVIAQGSNTLSISGNRSYPNGTVILINGDPYISISSSLDSLGNTKVVLASSATKNYIIPNVFRSVRPVYDPTQSVATSQLAHAGFSPILFKSNAASKSQLIQNVDYTFTDGGNINLTIPVQYGDEISAFYVARSIQPAGTSFTFNYAYQIAPNSTNGLAGQKLNATYNLYNPDTFFFRVESVESFIPEVLTSLQQSSTSSSSGPAIGDIATLQTKDYGNASIYFDQQHLTNIDIVVVRLLKFFNDQANLYEDLLANMDGRVVGGTSGRFRFNEDTSGTKRNNYADIQNDIDDFIKLRDEIELVSLNPITFADVPIYGPMWDYNNMSRLYGTFISRKTVAFNGNSSPADFGKILGSFGISNITSVGSFNTTHARAKFNSISADGLTLTMVGTNGDSTNLIPIFYAGQSVYINSPDNSLSLPKTISSVSTSNPYTVTINTPVNFQYGSVVANTSVASYPLINFYQNGNQISVNQDNGQITNTLLIGNPNLIAGNELVDADLAFVDKDTTPKRIPVLDGSELNDFGMVSDPPLTYGNETNSYVQESMALGLVGTGSVVAINQMNDCNVSVNVGDIILMLNGLNAGTQLTISAIISPIPPYAFNFTQNITIDATPRDLYVIGNQSGSLPNILNMINEELNILSTNTETQPVPPAIIGILNSEIITAINAASNLGIHLVDSIGTVSASNTLTDVSVNFATITPQITNSCFILVNSGPNTGLFKVGSIATNIITLDTTFPYGFFPSVGGSIQYSIVLPWQFVTINQASFLSYFILNTLAFISSTQTWLNNVTAIGTNARNSILKQRLSDIQNFISNITSILTSSDKIYDYRYLFIQQRVDKTNGLVTKINQAIKKQTTTIAQIASDQKKLLIMSELIS